MFENKSWCGGRQREKEDEEEEEKDEDEDEEMVGVEEVQVAGGWQEKEGRSRGGKVLCTR